MHSFATCGLFAVFLTSSCVADAATYHARVNGTGDCTRIQSCVDRLKAGDTLLIHGGRYGGFDVKAMSGTSTLPITIKAAPGEHAVIDAALGAVNFGTIGGATILGSSPKYIVIGDSDGVSEVTNTLPFVDEVRRLDMGKKAHADTYDTRYRTDWRAKLKAIRGGCTSAMWKASGWGPTGSSTTNDLRVMWGSSASDVWAAGTGGVLLHWAWFFSYTFGVSGTARIGRGGTPARGV